MPEPGGEEQQKFGLKRCLGFPGVLGQSIASIGMTVSVVVNIPLIYATAGTAMWWTYVVATLAVVFVTLNINVFSRDAASSGGLALYVENIFGPSMGILAGWALALAYVIVTMCVLGAYVENADVLGHALGFELKPWIRYGGSVAICVVLACWEVKFSTMLMLITEAISVTVIFILCLVVLAKHNYTMDFSLLTLKGDSFKAIASGLVLAVLSFTGYESATTLGYETRNPLRAIPRALLWAPVIAGLFFIFSAYVLALAFHSSSTPIATSADPLEMLSRQLGVEAFGWWIAFGAGVCCFGATLAALTAAARIFLSLAKRNFLPAFLGRVHPRFGTPYVALIVVGVIVVASTIGLEFIGCTPVDIFNYTGTVATFGFLLVYLLVAIGAPVYCHRKGTLGPVVILNSVIAVALLGFVAVSSVYPVPTAPMNYLPWIFLALFGAGIVILLVRKPSAEK